MTKLFCYSIPYSLSYLLTLLSLGGFYYGGAGFYFGLGLFFFIHPLLDNVIFKNLRIPHPMTDTPDGKGKTADLFFSFYLLLSPLVLSLTLLYGFYLAPGLSDWEFTGLILSTGAISGVLGINMAHELVHRREKWQRALGVYLLMTCNFAHWGIAHVFSHHKYVATPQDSATARKNETVYAFWRRAYFGGLREAIQIENKKKSWWHHRVLWYALVSLIASLLIFFLAGPLALIFWWGQSAVAILLLETVDYIEHYGLVREKNPETGLYESFKAKHSWDTSLALTNYVLVNLGLHSSHHLKTALHYPELQEQPGARRMPFGYSAMALIALVPPLYFKIVNPLLSEF